jgi:hypothetical protein
VQACFLVFWAPWVAPALVKSTCRAVTMTAGPLLNTDTLRNGVFGGYYI